MAQAERGRGCDRWLSCVPALHSPSPGAVQPAWALVVVSTPQGSWERPAPFLTVAQDSSSFRTVQGKRVSPFYIVE